MTREAMLELAREVDEARGIPAMSARRYVRQLIEDAAARPFRSVVKLDPESGLPAWLEPKLRQLLESWSQAPA